MRPWPTAASICLKGMLLRVFGVAQALTAGLLGAGTDQHHVGAGTLQRGDLAHQVDHARRVEAAGAGRQRAGAHLDDDTPPWRRLIVRSLICHRRLRPQGGRAPGARRIVEIAAAHYSMAAGGSQVERGREVAG